MSSNEVSLEGVSKRFGPTTVLQDMSLTLGAGELVTVLGPSGCGKTTALRILAGFETPTTGRVLVGGKDLTGAPSNRRGIGMVFQAYSLFPNMTVQDNVEYGLRVRKVAAEKRRSTAGEMLEMCGLGEFASRSPPSSPEGSSSVWPWPAHWPPSPGSCCWTSRSPRWTPSCGCRSVRRSGGCSSSWGSPPCS